VILVVIGALLAVLSLARKLRLPPAMYLTNQWNRLRPFVIDYVRASPATFTYLMILLITTLVMISSSDQVVSLLLQEHSTNLHELVNNPGRVLVLSAFWAPNYEFLVWAVMFALVLAPAERWLGSSRFITVFAMGHVLATLGVAWGLWLAIHHGYASHHLENTIDVGVSYGFAAVAAVFSFRLPHRWRWWWITALIAIAVGALVIGRSFTDAGHLLAVVIGFCCFPLTRDAGARARTSSPIWSARRADVSESAGE